MRAWMCVTVVLAAVLASGCAARLGLDGLEIPDREAIYERPLEEVWPEIRQFFTENNLPFREDKGSMVLQTEWRQEFGGSKIAGFWHRYMVLGKRESPTQSKLWVIRITKSANSTLARPGHQLDWGTSRLLGGGIGGGEQGGEGQSVGNGPGGDTLISPEDWEAHTDVPQGDNGHYVESAQGQRDLLMEWRVYRAVAPKLAKEENAPKPVVARAPTAKDAPSVVGVECGLPIIGLAKQVKKGGVLLLGEMHGTREVPRFVAQVACQSAVGGMPVTVGLELPLENQERVDRFIDSAGTEDDWLKLMEAPFWRSPYPDGRSSEAVANMLEQLRQLRAQGLDVDAFVFDHPKAQGQAREDAMAATVRHQVESTPNRFFVVLSGNIHARTNEGLPWDEDYRPMGMLLEDELDDVVALDMAYNSGSAWICAVDTQGRKNKLDCGIREARGKNNGERFFVHTWGGTNDAGYHGVFYVGPVNASEPAVHKGLGRPGSNDNSVHPARDQGKAIATVR